MSPRRKRINRLNLVFDAKRPVFDHKLELLLIATKTRCANHFFATLECEHLAKNRFKNRIEARMKVFKFIEGWYNPSRRHSALDYLSPVNYEQKYLSRSA